MIEQPRPARSATPPLPRWVTVIVILGALLTAAGGVIALAHPETLLGPGEHMNQAAHVYAGYLVSRNLALAVVLLAVLALGARRALTGLMVYTALAQLIDAVVDAATGRAALLPVVLVFAVAFLVGAARLSGPAWWKADGWRASGAPR